MRMMLSVTIISRRDGFIFHRFITDAIGHSIGSFITVAAGCLIDPHESRPCDIHYELVLAIAVSYIVCDFLIAKFLGNAKWFGLPALVTASIGGVVVFFIGAELVAGISGQGHSIYDLGAIMGLVTLYSIFFLIPAVIFPLIIRLMAYPIIGVFRPDR